MQKRAQYAVMLDLGLNGLVDLNIGYGSLCLGTQYCDHMQRLNREIMADKPWYCFTLIDRWDYHRVVHKGIGFDKRSGEDGEKINITKGDNEENAKII